MVQCCELCASQSMNVYHVTGRWDRFKKFNKSRVWGKVRGWVHFCISVLTLHY